MQTIREHIISRILQSFLKSQRRLFQKNLKFYKIYDMIR